MLTTNRKSATRRKKSGIRLTNVVTYIQEVTRYHELSIISLHLGNRIDRYAAERGIVVPKISVGIAASQKPSVNRNVKSNL